MKMEADTGVTLPQPRNSWGLRKLGEHRGADSHRSPQKEPTLLTPDLSWSSSLQNHETTHFCGLKPPSLKCFVAAALAN